MADKHRLETLPATHVGCRSCHELAAELREATARAAVLQFELDRIRAAVPAVDAWVARHEMAKGRTA